MSDRTRNLLHKNKLEVFKGWCEGMGFELPETKGDYEVLRVKTPDGLAIIHERLGARGDHYTTHGYATELVKGFIYNYQPPGYSRGAMGTAKFLDEEKVVKLVHPHKDGRLGSFEWCDRAGVRQRICIAFSDVTWDEEPADGSRT